MSNAIKTEVAKVLSLGPSASGAEIYEHVVVLPGLTTRFTTYNGQRISVGTPVQIELSTGGRIKNWAVVSPDECGRCFRTLYWCRCS